jgi:exosortase/archaeosortase family protein
MMGAGTLSGVSICIGGTLCLCVLVFQKFGALIKLFMQPYKPVFLYLLKFLGVFALLFYGTEAVIAFSSPERYYSPFVATYLDFVSPFRMFLLKASQALLLAGGWQTKVKGAYSLAFEGGASVRMVYSCLGYGVLSFWIAFVFANGGGWKTKAAWIAVGCLGLIGINICRIALILLATRNGWKIPFGWDHHTWFNIAAYALIFGMIYGYDRSGKAKPFAAPSTKRTFAPKKILETEPQSL